jgi:hypothetical protein
MLRTVSKSFISFESEVSDSWLVNEHIRRACQHSNEYHVRLLMVGIAG